MSDTVSSKDIIGMILAAVKKIEANHEELSRLDGATGDGDHGTTMLRTVKAVEGAINANQDASLKDLMGKIAWDVMSADGGSTGPLLGSFFMGMGEGVADTDAFNSEDVAKIIIAGVEKMHKQSRAQIGDKTMMDALLPAVDALKNADAGSTVAATLADAAKAAKEGSEATVDMTAKFGRARNLGERVLGHKDPGSVSMALMLEAFSESISK